MGDVGKRAAVDEGRRVFCCLHEIRVKGLYKQNGDGTSHTEVFYSEQLTVGSDT